MTIAEVLDRIDKSIEENRELALKHGKLTEAIENLLSLEKQTRLAEHLAGTSQLALAIVDLCRDAGNRKELNAQIVVLSKRVVEHNIRIISNYYGRITASRLAQLLDLSAEDTEKNVSEMVASKSLYARIDRPAGIVSFI
eukprot:EC121361.1.p1 GENE.EC121361.1~~EC121361.1.p1  ORF type:complete len:140 (+),score=13.00 EC121361.1:59-478(+)